MPGMAGETIYRYHIVPTEERARQVFITGTPELHLVSNHSGRDAL